MLDHMILAEGKAPSVLSLTLSKVVLFDLLKDSRAFTDTILDLGCRKCVKSID
jgi:hypothetical protein